MMILVSLPNVPQKNKVSIGMLRPRLLGRDVNLLWKKGPTSPFVKHIGIILKPLQYVLPICRVVAKNVAGRSKRMANSQELGAAFRFSLAGLDGRVQPRFSPTWMIWFFQKSGENTVIQRPQSFTPRAPIHVFHGPRLQTSSRISNSKAMTCESRIHQTEQQMQQITPQTFGHWDSALRFFCLTSPAALVLLVLTAPCLLHDFGKSRLATSMNLNSTNVPTGGDTGGLNHRKPGFPETHIYIIYPQMSPKMMKKKSYGK